MIGRTSGFFSVAEIIPLCVAAFYNENVTATNDDINELKRYVLYTSKLVEPTIFAFTYFKLNLELIAFELFSTIFYSSNFAQIGHFTELMQEENSRMGCGMVNDFDGSYFISICVCDYSAPNIIGRPVYRAGPTASLCTTGPNSEFQGLCSKTEPYNLFD